MNRHIVIYSMYRVDNLRTPSRLRAGYPTHYSSGGGGTIFPGSRPGFMTRLFSFQTGGTSVDSRIVCKDEDSANGPEPLTLTVTSDTCNGMFDIDNAGMVSRVKDVDVDASGTITSCKMTVRCEDDEGLSDTTEITVTISVSYYENTSI